MEHRIVNWIWLITLHAMPPAVCAGWKGKAWESGGKKRVQRNFRAPHYTLPLGIFTPFISRLMNCLHFSAFQAPQLFALVLVSLVALGKKQGGELEGIGKCIWISVYWILIMIFLFFLINRKLFLYITKMTMVNCLKWRKVMVLQLLIHFCGIWCS